MVRCLCPEDVMSENDLHIRHQSSRITLEHFHYTDGLKDTVEMLNASTGFKEYVIPRTLNQTGVVDELSTIIELKQSMAIPPVRISRGELQVAELAALGASVKDIAEALDISESAVKNYRASINSKGFMDNFCANLVKLIVHGVIDIKRLTSN